MKSLKRSVVITAIVLAMAVPLQPNSAADIVVNCYVLYYSECPACMTKYNTYVKPFYNKYRDNNTIKFLMVDSAIDASLFWETVYVLELNITELEGFPWVVFQHDDQLVVHDERTLDSIESTFISILEESGYIPITSEPHDGNIPIMGDINLSLLILAMMIAGGAILIISSPLVYYYHRSKPRVIFRRIYPWRFTAITSLSIISLISLSYQFLDYLQGGCGCSESNIVKQLLFRK
ncbi:MAG: hypothetical protein ACTSPV_03695, partial [Candidatus Hodarchaeales archaeon]